VKSAFARAGIALDGFPGRHLFYGGSNRVLGISVFVVVDPNARRAAAAGRNQTGRRTIERDVLHGPAVVHVFRNLVVYERKSSLDRTRPQVRRAESLLAG
jgi:hypothetical protein